MPAGRPRKLPQQEVIDGNTGKYGSKRFAAKLAARGLQAYGDLFEIDYIPEDSKQAIDLIKKSMPAGVYTSLDSFLVNAFAVAWAVHKLATQQLFDGNASDNFVALNTKSESENLSGWYKVFESSTRLMASLATQLGLDPRARLAMMNPNETPEEDGLLGSAAHN